MYLILISLRLLVTVYLFTDTAQDLFREVNGLQSILSFITSTTKDEVVEAGLYCLGSAVERNGITSEYKSYQGLNCAELIVCSA